MTEISLEMIKLILTDQVDDATVNAWVLHSLGFRWDPHTQTWDPRQAQWQGDGIPDFMQSRPDVVKLTRGIPPEHKQLLKEVLKFPGYQVHELTPRKTRRATAANWLLHIWKTRQEQGADV